MRVFYDRDADVNLIKTKKVAFRFVIIVEQFLSLTNHAQNLVI